MCGENQKTLKFYIEKGEGRESPVPGQPRLLFGCGARGTRRGSRHRVPSPRGSLALVWVWKRPQLSTSSWGMAA